MATDQWSFVAQEVLRELQQALNDRHSFVHEFYTKEQEVENRITSTIASYKSKLSKITLQMPEDGRSHEEILETGHPEATSSRRVSFAADVEDRAPETADVIPSADKTDEADIFKRQNNQEFSELAEDSQADSQADLQAGLQAVQAVFSSPTRHEFFISAGAQSSTVISTGTPMDKGSTMAAKRIARDLSERVGIDGAMGLEPEDLLPKQAAGNTHRKLLKVVESKWFELVSTLVIISNTVTLVVSFEYSIQKYYDPELPIFGKFEAAFLSLYVLEALMRMLAYRKRFFTGADRYWNMFDLLMIICTVPDRIVAIIGRSFLNISFLRIIRMVKMLKIGRVARLLKNSLQVRLMLLCVRQGMGEIVPLFLSIILLLGMFSLCILSLVGNFLQSQWRTIHPELLARLLEDWGSMKDVMLSCFMAVTGGIEWEAVSRPLREAGTFVYAVFLLFIAFYSLVATNFVTCMFIHVMLVCADNADKFKVTVQLQRRKRLVHSLERLLGVKELTYDEFYQHLMDDSSIANYLSAVMGTSRLDADFLFYTLSASGTEVVEVKTFILGCIELKSPVSKLDLLKQTANIDSALEEHAEHYSALDIGTHPTTPNLVTPSVEDERHIQIKLVGEATLWKYLQSISYRLSTQDEQTKFNDVCRRLVDVLRAAQGGCGFLLTTSKGFSSMRNLHIDFQVVDKDLRFTKGYMTEVLCDRLNSDIQSQSFLDAMVHFTAHGCADRWPEDHEASGLPKDGYTIMSMSGKILKGASRIIGLPTPPFRWEGVGMRHLAGLASCWALRLYPSLVVVRSDSGRIHWLFADGPRITALQLTEQDEYNTGVSNSTLGFLRSFSATATPADPADPAVSRAQNSGRMQLSTHRSNSTEVDRTGAELERTQSSEILAL